MVTVAAASFLQGALPELGAAFVAAGGRPLDITYDATGVLARRIHTGARFDVVLAADRASITNLAAADLLADAGHPYAEARLSLVASKRSALARELSLGRLAEAARNGEPFRLALPDPDVSPHGVAALDVCERWSVARLLQPRITIMPSAAAAFEAVVSGRTEAAITARPLVRTARATASLSTLDLPGAWHPPLVQYAALAGRVSDDALQFYDFLLEASARVILLRHGFGLPGLPD
jgi:molybdate transport system substrate-binding protein